MSAGANRSVSQVLLGAQMVVVAVVATLGFVTVRHLTPTLFNQHLGLGGQGQGGGGGGGPRGGRANPFTDPTAVADSLDRSVTVAAALAAGAGLVVALMVAWMITRLLVRRLTVMSAATARLAAGDHQVRVDEPPEVELAELARSINQLGASLAATEQTRARLISDLAHELRNPLTTIQGSMEALIDGVVPATAETFESVAEEADRLRRLTEDLSLLARGQEGALGLEPITVELLAAVTTTTERLRPQFELKGVDLSVVGTPATVKADHDRLAQVLVNTVGNALTHTPTGGAVTVTVSTVETDPGGQGPWARVAVADTGVGIPTDQLRTVFDRYTRLDPQSPGTGVGLNIARTLIEAHGGRISAHSDGAGTGATFVIDLPLPAIALPAGSP